jgi:hypothetical protein
MYQLSHGVDEKASFISHYVIQRLQSTVGGKREAKHRPTAQ